MKPWNADPDNRLELGAFRVDKNHLVYSSHMELVNGAFARYKWISRLGVAEVGYNLNWRHIHNLAQDASLSIREQVGHSLKSSVTASVFGDKRDDSIMPTSGYSYKLSGELAGILESRVRFAKGEAETTWATSLGHGFSLAAGLRAGVLKSFARQSQINDRFFLGGPLTVRGFRHNGLGPKDGVDSLGGDAYCAAGLSLFTPLPYLVDKPLKGHLFVNVGGLGAMQNCGCPLPLSSLYTPFLTSHIVFVISSLEGNIQGYHHATFIFSWCRLRSPLQHPPLRNELLCSLDDSKWRRLPKRMESWTRNQLFVDSARLCRFSSSDVYLCLAPELHRL